MWCELESKAAFDKALQDLPADKLLVVDYYAPWCAVCKTAYSSLCRIADTREYKQGYVFCKVRMHAQLSSMNPAVQRPRQLPLCSLFFVEPCSTDGRAITNLAVATLGYPWQQGAPLGGGKLNADI
jgi:thiol:disulfide interchange protein